MAKTDTLRLSYDIAKAAGTRNRAAFDALNVDRDMPGLTYERAVAIFDGVVAANEWRREMRG